MYTYCKAKSDKNVCKYDSEYTDYIHLVESHYLGGWTDKSVMLIRSFNPVSCLHRPKPNSPSAGLSRLSDRNGLPHARARTLYSIHPRYYYVSFFYLVEVYMVFTALY